MSFKNGQNEDQIPTLNISYSTSKLPVSITKKELDIKKIITLSIASFLLAVYSILSILYLTYSIINGVNNIEGFASSNGYSNFGLVSVSLISVFGIFYFVSKYLQTYIFNNKDKVKNILNIVTISMFYLLLLSTSLSLYAIPLRTRIIEKNNQINAGLIFTIISSISLVAMVLLNVFVKNKNTLNILNAIVPFILVWLPTFAYPIYSLESASLTRGSYMLVIYALLADISFVIPNKKVDDEKIDYIPFVKDIFFFAAICVFAMCIFSNGIINKAFLA